MSASDPTSGQPLVVSDWQFGNVVQRGCYVRTQICIHGGQAVQMPLRDDSIAGDRLEEDCGVAHRREAFAQFCGVNAAALSFSIADPGKRKKAFPMDLPRSVVLPTCGSDATDLDFGDGWEARWGGQRGGQRTTTSTTTSTTVLPRVTKIRSTVGLGLELAANTTTTQLMGSTGLRRALRRSIATSLSANMTGGFVLGEVDVVIDRMSFEAELLLRRRTQAGAGEKTSAVAFDSVGTETESNATAEVFSPAPAASSPPLMAGPVSSPPVPLVRMRTVNVEFTVTLPPEFPSDAVELLQALVSKGTAASNAFGVALTKTLKDEIRAAAPNDPSISKMILRVGPATVITKAQTETAPPLVEEGATRTSVPGDGEDSGNDWVVLGGLFIGAIIVVVFVVFVFWKCFAKYREARKIAEEDPRQGWEANG